MDGDRSIGNPVVYSIVSGPSDIFAVNRDTGAVYTQRGLDRESPRSSDGAFILGIEAREVGGGEDGGRGGEAVTAEVTIIIEVRPYCRVVKVTTYGYRAGGLQDHFND